MFILILQYALFREHTEDVGNPSDNPSIHHSTVYLHAALLTTNPGRFMKLMKTRLP